MLKRIIKVSLPLCVMFCVLVLTVSAGLNAPSTWEDERDLDLTKSYERKSGDEWEATARYNPANLFLSVRASTDVNIPLNGQGTAYAYVLALNGEWADSIDSSTTVGVLKSGKATVAGQDYAQEVWHTATYMVYGQSTAIYCKYH